MTEGAVRLVERQLRYEVEAVERGVNRYRQMLVDQPLADTEPGRELVVGVLKSLIPAIEAAQEEAVQGLTRTEHGQGRPATWWYPILCLKAEKMALITVRIVLSKPCAKTEPQSISRLAMDVASAIRQEREFDLWRDAQKEAHGSVNMVKLMLSRVKVVDKVTTRKWMKRGAAFDKLEWPPELRLQIGTKLLALLVDSSGGLFEEALMAVPRGRRRMTERKLVLSDQALRTLADRHAQCELIRPWLLPMLAPPNDWRPVNETPMEERL